MGPTATGKTELAIELTKRFPLEIISADSALVYKGLDKGTAKPTHEQLKMAPHRLMDICDPTQVYSAGDFYKDVHQEIKKIYAHKKIPLIVGGTPLYFWVLKQGIAELPPADKTIREEIAAKAIECGWEVLHQELQNLDAISATKIKPQDGQRIQRALEVFRLTGKPLSAYHEKRIFHPEYKTHSIILNATNRAFIHKRIQKRLENFFEDGLIEEVEQLRQLPGIHKELPAMRLVGYRQTWEYLEGQYDLQKLKEKTYYATCQLVKRQCTWLRRWEDATQLAIDEPTEALTPVCELLNEIVFDTFDGL